jgi:hypothetical protein
MIDTADSVGGRNVAQITYWNDRIGVTWTTFQEQIDTVFAPLTAMALEAAAPAAGERTIDVGSRCGATLLELARRRADRARARAGRFGAHVQRGRASGSLRGNRGTQGDRD